jgi:hypothetical protein
VRRRGMTSASRSGTLARAGTKKRRLQDAALGAFDAHAREHTLPTSIRFLFYELEQQGMLSKVRTGARRAEQDFIDAITALREQRAIPWDWVVDDSRVLHAWPDAPSVAEYADAAAARARIDPWIGVRRPIILTEARTVAGVFARTLAPEYVCSVAATNGQAHGFLITEIAPLFNNDTTRCLYLGDLDLSGGHCEANTRRIIKTHTGRTFTDDDWERVAITPAQADQLRARGVRPIQKHDRRYRGGRVHEAYECEAIGQRVLQDLLRARLDALLPEPLATVLERENRQRVEVRRVLAKLRK